MRIVIILVASAAAPAALGLAGLWVRLGAHPFWDVSTALIGAPIGALAAWGAAALPVPPAARHAFGVLVLAASAACAWQGKARFAASFAEDALAGRLWHLGWIGVSAGLALVLASAAMALFPRRA